MGFNTVIVGLGNIGLEYDLGLSNSILTHAKAISLHPEFDLKGGVDLNSGQRQKLEATYTCPTFREVKDAVEDNPDVVVVATSTVTHRDVVESILSCCTPKLILCEKPFGSSFTDANYMSSLADQCDVQIAVNYIRRFEPGACEIKRRIDNGMLGEQISGIARYSGDLLNNGSHMLNLLMNWFGDVKSIELLSKADEVGCKQSMTDLVVQFEAGSIFLIANRITEYQLFEVDICGSNSRFFYQDSGRTISWSGVTKEPYIKGSNNLIAKYEGLPTDFYRYQWYVYEQIANYLQAKSDSLASVENDALLTHKHLSKWIT